MTENTDTVSFEGLDPAEVVHALYHGTRALGMGALHDQPKMTVEQVRDALALHPPTKNERRYLDYFYGRPLKIDLDLHTKTFRSRLYDRDAGHGQAQYVIDQLRARSTPSDAGGK